VFAPSRMFGCGISDLRIDQGIHNLLALMDYVNYDHKDGKVMLISLRALHLEAGVGYQIMECPENKLSYLCPTWLTELRDFSGQNEIGINIRRARLPILSQVRD
jgi:hypothetical protein